MGKILDFPLKWEYNNKKKGYYIMFCKNCGGKVDENDYICQHCGARISDGKTCLYEYKKRDNSVKEDDSSSLGFAILSFFFPFIGLILWLVWRDDRPLRAHSCAKGALLGFIVSVICSLLAFIISYSIFSNFLFALM